MLATQPFHSVNLVHLDVKEGSKGRSEGSVGGGGGGAEPVSDIYDIDRVHFFMREKYPLYDNLKIALVHSIAGRVLTKGKAPRTNSK